MEKTLAKQLEIQNLSWEYTDIDKKHNQTLHRKVLPIPEEWSPIEH